MGDWAQAMKHPMETAACTCTDHDSTARAGKTVTEYNVEGLKRSGFHLKVKQDVTRCECKPSQSHPRYANTSVSM